MYIGASAPDAPPFSDTPIGCFIRLFFWMAACIMRAIWSEAPPAPAATTISTGLVGSQPAATAGAPGRMIVSAAAALISSRTCFFPFWSDGGFILERSADAGGASLHAIGLYRRVTADSS